MEFKHFSVLLAESVDALNISDNGIYFDGTLGGGGHSFEILSRNKTVRVIATDRDKEAIAAAGKRLLPYKDRAVLINDNFRNIKNILRERNIESISGAVLDLGVSSYQLDNPERGFSYMHDAPLDMRMNRDDSLTAYEVINSYSEDELAKIFYAYGEEKWSKRIARFVVQRREKAPIATTLELVDVIKAAIPAGARAEGGHPAKRVFQAVRIEVNGELKLLKDAIFDITDCLEPGGRFAVITFHSLEDRIVKKSFAELQRGCICPKDFPVCVCGNKPKVKAVSGKPIYPSEGELRVNSRSKSAKLRVIEKL